MWQLKLKKRQKEAERCTEIVLSNLILLRHLAEISLSKRVDDGMNPKGGGAADWNYDHYGTIAALRKLQLERMADQTKVGKLGVVEDQDHDGPQKTEEKLNEGNTKNGKKKKKRSRTKAKQEGDS